MIETQKGPPMASKERLMAMGGCPLCGVLRSDGPYAG
jgi:hypothetical protein